MLLNTVRVKNSHTLGSPRVAIEVKRDLRPATGNPFANRRRSETVKASRDKVLQLRRDQVVSVRKASVETT